MNESRLWEFFKLQFRNTVLRLLHNESERIEFPSWANAAPRVGRLLTNVGRRDALDLCNTGLARLCANTFP